MIMTLDDYYEYGNMFGIDQALTDKYDPNFIHCNHTKSKTQNYAIKNANYKRSSSTYSGSHATFNGDEESSSIWQSKFLGNILRTIGGVIALFCFIFIMIFLREFCIFLWHKITNKEPERHTEFGGNSINMSSTLGTEMSSGAADAFQQQYKQKQVEQERKYRMDDSSSSSEEDSDEEDEEEDEREEEKEAEFP